LCRLDRKINLFNFIANNCLFTLGSESPSFHGDFSFGGRGLLSPSVDGFQDILTRSNRTTPNEISAPYEVPQFPIEEIERKLAIQRQLSVRSVSFLNVP
jgi:AMP deaminase